MVEGIGSRFWGWALQEAMSETSTSGFKFGVRPYRMWRSNPSRKCSQEQLTQGTVTGTMRREAYFSGRARCGAGAGCSAVKYWFFFEGFRACGLGRRP